LPDPFGLNEEKINSRTDFKFYLLNEDMDNVSLYSKIISLPENLKKEVQEFVELLQTRTKKNSRKKPRDFGSLKGKIKMIEDFDAPIDDFKEYM
jgi:hypothetical protein